MVENKKNGEARPGGNTAAIILFAAVAVLLAAGVYYIWQGSQHPTPPENQNASQMDTPMAKLLLSAYEKGGKLDVYYLKYMMNDSGAESHYEIGSNGSDQWVVLSGDFGAVEGYFGKNGTKDLVCLDYDAVKKCGRIRNDTQTAGIAATLKSYLPNKQIYAEQADFVRKLIGAGAIRFVEGTAQENSGGFDAERVEYSLSYKNMTVSRLLELGISPNSVEVVARSNQKITMWIDRETGLVARSLATYREGGADFVYETIYSRISLAAPAVPEPNVGVVDAETFARFYQSSMEDYEAKQECFAMGAAERDLCLKNLAVGRMRPGVCGLIAGNQTREQCVLIIAQSTNTPDLCGSLALYPDDCYIAIAGETGNYELCGNLKNTSLLSDCNDAAAKGARKKEDEAERMRRLEESRNCGTDSDCGLLGNAGQYCLPKNSTLALADEVSPLHSCLAGIPCGCNEGFCGFRKNDSYYACISEVETGLTEEYIQGIIAQANSTNSSG